MAEETLKILTFWKDKINLTITWDIRPPTYPRLTEFQQPIKSAVGPGVTQRLFFPEILPEYNALYMLILTLYFYKIHLKFGKLSKTWEKSHLLVPVNMMIHRKFILEYLNGWLKVLLYLILVRFLRDILY